MIEVVLTNKTIFIEKNNVLLSSLKLEVANKFGFHEDDFYLILNGKRCNTEVLANCRIHFVPKICGGKGGFGSMLRAIGAQIEKTTNREACRDLSGRRLRDINEEKRLKTWIAQQAEREKEAQNRKQKKLEKLCQEPKFEFKDENYDKERSDLPEKVEDAVLKGLQVASTSGIGQKRKATDNGDIKKKKPKLWVDADLEAELSSSDESESSETQNLEEMVVNYNLSENTKGSEDYPTATCSSSWEDAIERNDSPSINKEKPEGTTETQQREYDSNNVQEKDAE